MISNELIQAAIVAKLKADTDLTNFLTARSAGSEIREAAWQGSAFVYPAVRVEPGTQTPIGNGKCYLTNSETPFTIFSFSEDDSSKQADILAGLVNAALLGKRLSGTGFRSLVIQSDGLLHAARTGERVWQATGLYRMVMYET